MNHTAQITARWYDCGEITVQVTCACGYTGLYTEGRGCWQEGHNVLSDVDAAHDPLITQAFGADGPLATWAAGPREPERTVTVGSSA